MINKEMSTDSVLHDTSAGAGAGLGTGQRTEAERMLRYSILARAFSYPDDTFFTYFPDYEPDKESIRAEYDRLFRAGEVWLYSAEYQAQNEFQRAKLLSDIMGFYMAFGLEPDKERPDAITCEMEFMHYLILKRDRIRRGLVEDNPEEKTDICRQAESKLFSEHLAPAAESIAEKIISKSSHPFYVRAAEDLVAFIEDERKLYGPTGVRVAGQDDGKEVDGSS